MEAQKFDERVGDGYLPGLQFGHQVAFERAIDLSGFRAQLAGVGDMHLGWEIEHVFAAGEGDAVVAPVELVEVPVGDDLVVLEATGGAR